MLARAAALCLALVLVAAPALLARGDDPPGLGHLARASLGARLPPQWKARSVSGAAAPRTEVVEWQGRRAIRFHARDAAGWYGVETGAPLDPAAGRLAWSWQIGAPLAGAALRQPRRDDAPARLAVVFGRASLLARPRVLFYTWGNRETVGESWRSHVSDRFGIVVLRNAADPSGRWVAEERDLRADYARVFGGTAPAVTAVGFMIDTEQTGAEATSHLGAVRWVARTP